jgi:electron transfer flavoprotein alpha/beta subunit
MKDAGVASEIIAVTVGPKQVGRTLGGCTTVGRMSHEAHAINRCSCSLACCSQAVDQLRTALAMGADKGVHIETDVRIDQVGRSRQQEGPARRVS